MGRSSITHGNLDAKTIIERILDSSHVMLASISKLKDMKERKMSSFQLSLEVKFLSLHVNMDESFDEVKEKIFILVTMFLSLRSWYLLGLGWIMDTKLLKNIQSKRGAAAQETTMINWIILGDYVAFAIWWDVVLLLFIYNLCYYVNVNCGLEFFTKSTLVQFFCINYTHTIKISKVFVFHPKMFSNFDHQC